MKKVLFVFNHPAPYKVRLFNELSKHFDIHVIFERTSTKGRSKKFYFENNYDFVVHPIRGIKFGQENFISNKIKKHIKHNNYDLIVMNGYSTFAEMKAINYLKKKNIPYIFYINGGTVREKESTLRKAIKTHFIKGAKYYLSPDEQSNKYLTYYGAEKDRIFNYPYSTIYEKEILNSATNKEKTKNKIGINFDHVFVSAGQLIKRKNYQYLVKEWAKMPSNYGLFIFGDGKEKKKILQTLKQNNISNVVLKDFSSRTEMFDFFRLSDAFVFPSKQDIYGHVINEALSQGLPIISSKFVNSSLHLIKNGVNGFLLESFEAENLKKYCDEIIKTNLFENCIQTAKENTIELMTECHVKIFEEVMRR